MPCHYTGSAEGDARLAADEARKALTEVTQLLCSTIRTVEDHWISGGEEVNLPKEVKAWWKKHEKIDEARRKKETKQEKESKLKASALSKLTKAEKKILNIKD